MNNQPTKTETMNGGAAFVAALLDASNVEIFIRQLPVRQMAEYLKAQGNEAELVELCCTVGGKQIESGVVDNLNPESHAALVFEVERINNDFFLQWGKRQKARAQKLKENFGDML